MRLLLFPLIVIGAAVAIFLWTRGPKPTPIDTSLTQSGKTYLPANPIPRLDPGTRVGSTPPAGWTQIILKTRPNVTSGDVGEVDEAMLTAIRKFSTSVLGRTEPDPENPGKFRVGGYAAGMGVNLGDEDVIITSKTAAEHGVTLSTFEGIVFGKREDELAQFVSPVVTRTMVLVDLPAYVLRGTDHVKVVMRYSALVDVKDGRIHTLCWMLDKAENEGSYTFAGDSFTLMEPNQTMSWELHVDTSKYSFGLPTPEAFAATTLPRGTPLKAPDDLKFAAAAKRFTAQDADELEEQLRKLAGLQVVETAGRAEGTAGRVEGTAGRAEGTAGGKKP
jgi:hypothetical protein